MPAVAIFASGYLAVRLQKKEHVRQAALQDIEDRKRARIETRRQKGELNAQSHPIHKLISEVAYKYDDRQMMDALRQASLITTPYRASDIPGAQSVGYWLSNKQIVALGHIKTAGPGRQTAVDVQQYFMDVQHALDFWVMDLWKAEWFAQDAERLVSTSPTLKEEEERAASLLHIERDS
jgi:hypothetical protein